MNLLGVAAGNLVHRARLLGWSWRQVGWSRSHARVGYALWLDGWRGPPHRARKPGELPCGLGEDDLIYGETPLATAEWMLREAVFPPGGRLLEIGCGRAALSLLAAERFQARADGWEVVPRLAARAQWLTRALGFERQVTIHTGLAGGEPLPPADLAYLASTTWSDDNLARLAEALTDTPQVITLSRPLPGASWTVRCQHSLPFSWGWNRVFWNQRL